MKVLLFHIFLLFSIFYPILLFAQSVNDFNYPKGYSPALTSEEISKIKDMFKEKNPNWVGVKKLYFKGVYDSELPDIICYITKKTAKIGLIKDSKPTNELFNERYVWILIFSEYDLNDEKNHKNLARVNLDVLDYQYGPGEYAIRNILEALSKLIFGATSEKKELEDTLNIKFTKNGNCGNRLFTWMGKFKIGLNTKNRIVITPPENSKEKRFKFINYNFGNFEKPSFGASLGFGYTWGNDLNDSSRVNLYLFGHIYICPPKLPVSEKSFSIVVGTNFITGELLNNIIVGLRGGFLNNASGIIIGVNLFLFPNNKRNPRVFVGLDYRL